MTSRMMKTMMIAMAVVGGVAAVPEVASAQQIQAAAPARELRGLSLSLVVANGRRFGDGYRLFDREGGDVAGGAEVALEVMSLGGSGRLALGAGIQGEGYESESGGSVAATLETTSLYATAIARFRAAATWQPYAAVAAGMERGELALNANGQQPIASEALGAFGRVSLGVRFAPRRLTVRTQAGNPIFALALGLEVAGTLGTPLDFEYRAEPASQGAGDSDRIPTGTVALGSVARTAVQGRGLISLVF